MGVQILVVDDEPSVRTALHRALRLDGYDVELAANGAGAGAGALAAGAATAGQVKLVDGANIYVTDAHGNVVKVVTTPAVRFTKTGAGPITDVRPGDTVIVQGQKGEDGIVTATAVANSGAAS